MYRDEYGFADVAVAGIGSPQNIYEWPNRRGLDETWFPADEERSAGNTAVHAARDASDRKRQR